MLPRGRGGDVRPGGLFCCIAFMVDAGGDHQRASVLWASMKRGAFLLVFLVHCGRRDPVPTPAPVAAVMPATATASSLPPTPSAQPEVTTSRREFTDLTSSERARALSAIGDIRPILRRRMAAGRETDEACEARDSVEMPRLEAASKKLGPEAWHRKTRFSERAPNLGATVESFVAGCMGCTGFGPDDDEAVPHECGQAMTVLSDLADELKAAK